eukprot:gene4619-5770_t
MDDDRFEFFPSRNKRYSAPPQQQGARVYSTTIVNSVPPAVPMGRQPIPATYPPRAGFAVPPSPQVANEVWTAPPGVELSFDPVTGQFKAKQTSLRGPTSEFGNPGFIGPIPGLPRPNFEEHGFNQRFSAPPLTPHQIFGVNGPPPQNNKKGPPLAPTMQTYNPPQQHQQQHFNSQPHTPPFQQNFNSYPPHPLQPPMQPQFHQQPPMQQQFQQQPPPQPQQPPQQFQQKPPPQQHPQQFQQHQPSPPPQQPPQQQFHQNPPQQPHPNQQFQQQQQPTLLSRVPPAPPAPNKLNNDNIGMAKEYPTQQPTPPPLKETPEEKKLKERNRTKSLSELVSTEESYSENLEKLILYYKIPLDRDKIKLGCTSQDISNLFSNIEALLVVSKDLLLKLKFRFGLPVEQQTIGDIYVGKAQEMKLYVEYINNYENAMKTLERIESTSPSFFKDCQKDYKYSLDIRSLMIMPVQRIPRYELLLREIIKYTNPDHIDYRNLQEAYNSVREINNYINNNKKLRENKDRVFTIAQQLKGCPNTLMKSSRRWIREGVLETTCSSKKYKGTYMIYLFNDLIVLAKESSFRKKLEYIIDIDLDNSEFKEISENDTVFRFISDPEGKTPLIFTFESESLKSKESWIKDLKLLEEERKLNRVNHQIQSLI